MKLRIDLPDENTPGYWRRVEDGAKLMEEMKTGLSLESCKKVIDYIMPYVTEPEDKEQAHDLIADLSKKEFQKIIRAVMGAKENEAGANTTVPPENSAPPADGSLPTV